MYRDITSKKLSHTFSRKKYQKAQKDIGDKIISDIATILDLSETTVHFYINTTKKTLKSARDTVKLNNYWH